MVSPIPPAQRNAAWTYWARQWHDHPLKLMPLMTSNTPVSLGQCGLKLCDQNKFRPLPVRRQVKAMRPQFSAILSRERMDVVHWTFQDGHLRKDSHPKAENLLLKL